MPSPLATVKSKFETKDKLVDTVVGLLAKDSDLSKDDLRRKLAPLANKKLLKLHDVAEQVKKDGGRDKLVAATAEALGKSKDKPFVDKLDDLSMARLLDIQKAARRRQKHAAD